MRTLMSAAVLVMVLAGCATTARVQAPPADATVEKTCLKDNVGCPWWWTTVGHGLDFMNYWLSHIRR